MGSGADSALGSFVTGSDGRFVYVDDVLLEMVGGKSDDWMANLAPEDRASVGAAIENGLTARQPFAVEFAGPIGASAVSAFCLRVAPIFNGEEFIGLAGTVEDLSERRELELAAEQASLQAKTANVEKSRFLAKVGREFRIPLNTMLGFAQVLEMEAATDGQRDSIDSIRRAGSYLLSLIDDVVDLGSIESKTLELHPESLLLSTVIQKAADVVRPLAQSRAVQIDMDDEMFAGIYVVADRHRLRQVLVAVLENGVKYNKPEGTISISGKIDLSGTFKLSISDTGIGISADKIEMLFTPFERPGAKTSLVEGAGLGLAISQRLMHAMEGTLEVESEEDVGSTFTLSLQCVESLAAVGDSEERVLEQLFADHDSPDICILLIEDDELNIRLIEAIFQRRSSFRVEVAMTGVLGLELATRMHPDVILLDVNLPDVSGTGLIEKLRAERSLAATPIIVISADASEKQIKKFRESGANQYLTKPIIVSDLLRAIEAQLQMA